MQRRRFRSAHLARQAAITHPAGANVPRCARSHPAANGDRRLGADTMEVPPVGAVLALASRDEQRRERFSRLVDPCLSPSQGLDGHMRVSVGVARLRHLMRGRSRLSRARRDDGRIAARAHLPDMQVDDPMPFASGAPQIPMAVMGLVVPGGRMLPRLTKRPRTAMAVARGQLVGGRIGAAWEALGADQQRDRRRGQPDDLLGLSLVSRAVLAEKHMAGSESVNRDVITRFRRSPGVFFRQTN